MRRPLLVAGGFVFLGIGAIGVVLPLLPTTPFLLLAAACFLRGSPRWHAWLLENRVFGKYLRGYLETGQVPRRTKVGALVVLWTTLGVSIILTRTWYVTLALLVVGAAVSVHIALLGRGKRGKQRGRLSD